MTSCRFFNFVVPSLLTGGLLTTIAIVALLIPSNSYAAVDDVTIDLAKERDLEVIRSFLTHLDEVGAERGEQAKRAVNDHADSAVEALTEGLIALYPDYANAVAASDDDRLEDAVRQLTPLTQSDDVYLAADATFFLARTYMNHERYEDAIDHLENLTSSAGNVSVHQGPAQYFLGLAQSGLLKKQEAFDSYVKFLKENPHAPERMRVSAWRQAEKLAEIKEGELPDVHQRMNYSRRRLEQQKTDPDTQQEQDKIVKMLNELIKKAEKEEASSSSSSSKNKDQKKNQNDKKPKKDQKGGKPSAPKPSAGKNNKGGAQPNGTAEIKNYDESPASPWSRLRDRSRDPANNAVKEKLPARYRDIVERYMEAANGETEK